MSYRLFRQAIGYLVEMDTSFTAPVGQCGTPGNVSRRAMCHAGQCVTPGNVSRREKWWVMTRSPDFDADPIRLLHIDFVGGPYDGHVETDHTRARLLPKDVTWRVSADALRRLHEDGHDWNADPYQSVTRVALYARQTAGETYRYRFVGAISIKQLTDSIRDHEER